jgi:hypothetical protein
MTTMTTMTDAAARPARSARRMRPRVRKTVLLLHVISSVGWLGLTFGNLVLAIAGLTTSDPQLQQGIYRVLGVLVDFVLLPISLTAFVTGLVLSLGTPWGLFRHRWVAVKFWLTLVAVLLTLFSLMPGVHETVRIVSETPPGRLAELGGGGQDLLYAACVSGTMYLLCTILSIFKPRLGK